MAHWSLLFISCIVTDASKVEGMELNTSSFVKFTLELDPEGSTEIKRIN